MRRRRFLSGLALATATGLAGCSNTGQQQPTGRPTSSSNPSTGTPAGRTGQPPTERYPHSLADQWGFDRVVNLGARGADQTGRKPTASHFDRHLTDGTLVYLPPGRYRLGETVSVSGGGRYGVVGENATIVPPDGYDGVLFGLGYPEPLGGVFVQGVTFDFRAERTGARPLFAIAENRIEVREVDVRGRVDVDQDLFRFDVTRPSGRARIERVRLPDGAETGTGNTGIEVGSENHGNLEFVDCHVAGFPDNGLYANPPEGEVSVVGGSYVNNGIAGVRIETKDDGLVRGVHVRCDDAAGSGENMRGIRLKTGESLLVEDCLVELLEVTSSDGAVTFSSELGSATVRNSQLRVDADGVNAIRIKAPGDGTSSAAHHGPFRCQNVVVTGNAAGGAAIAATNRRGCEFANVCVHQTGRDRDGLVADNVVGELHDSYFSVTGTPLLFTSSDIQRRNVSLNRRPEVAENAVDRRCSGPVEGSDGSGGE